MSAQQAADLTGSLDSRSADHVVYGCGWGPHRHAWAIQEGAHASPYKKVIEGKPGYYPKVTWYYADAELVTAEAKEHARGDGHAGRSKGNDHRIDEMIPAILASLCSSTDVVARRPGDGRLRHRPLHAGVQ